MKRVEVHTIHGKPFRRCGRVFTGDPTTLTVGEGGDISEADLAWMKRAAKPQEQGGVLRIRPAAPQQVEAADENSQKERPQKKGR